MIRSRNRRRAGRGGGGSGHGMPALVPMIDMLTILVVYLLVHAADYEIVPNTKNISIPQSISDAKPHEATTVMVTRDAIFVNGTAVARTSDLQASTEPVVESLKAALQAEAAKELVGAPVGAGDPAAGREVTVLADKGLPYAMLKKIMASCSAADYRKVSLAVIEKERAYAGPNPV